jgi:small GTP-binding protein
MGQTISSWFKYFFSFPESRITIVGLDSSGKTTLLYRLKTNELVTTIPTIGFNVEQVTLNKITFTIWDAGGRDKIRPLIVHYFKDCDALIIMIDSNDEERFQELKELLDSYLVSPDIENGILLFFANKQDLKGAKTCEEIAIRLELNKVKQKWKIQPCSGLEGYGIKEGFDWLSDEIKKIKK